MNRPPRFIHASTALLSTLVVGTAFADTTTVCLDGSCDFVDPVTAVANATAGDVIEIAAGTYLLEESVVPGAGVTVRGAVDEYGQPATILDGQGAILVMGTVYADDAVFENLVITGGYGEYGGGARFVASSDVILRNCHFRGNHANWDGGGIRMSLDTTLTLSNCEITDNTANHPQWPGQGHGAGIHNSGGTLILEETRVCGNVATGFPSDQISGGGTIDLGSCITSECDTCVTADPADFNRDSVVDGQDLAYLPANWMTSNTTADLNVDGIVSGPDLTALLAAWN